MSHYGGALIDGMDLLVDGPGGMRIDTHGSTVRMAPPLVADWDDVAWRCDQLAAALEDLT